MSTSISPSNKSNIITYRNSKNNGDSKSNSGGDNDNVNEDISIKITQTQDEPYRLVNHKTIILGQVTN